MDREDNASRLDGALMAQHPEHALPPSSLDTFHVFGSWMRLGETGRKDDRDVSSRSAKNSSGLYRDLEHVELARSRPRANEGSLVEEEVYAFEGKNIIRSVKFY